MEARFFIPRRQRPVSRRISRPLLRSVLAMAFTMFSWTALAEAIKGSASVIDGDTVEVAGIQIQLFGIDAPESSQRCRGHEGKQYHCGTKSATALRAFLDGGPISCMGERSRSGRLVATCNFTGTDLGGWMVARGLALDAPRYSKGKYAKAQRAAVRAGRGVWVGSFVLPRMYRACIKAGGRPSGCSNDARSH